MNARWYLSVAALSALLVAGGIRLANCWALAPDTVDRTRHVLEQKMTALLLADRPVVILGQFNERMLRWHYARRMTAGPQTVVFGSSHSLGVTAAQVGAGRAFNFSISGGSLAEHLVTAGILQARGIKPHRWVIFVDAWLFDSGADSGVWRQRAGDLFAMETRLAASAHPSLPHIFSAADATPAGDDNPFTLNPLIQAFDGSVGRYTVRAFTPGGGVTSAQLMATDGSLDVYADETEATPESSRARAIRQYRNANDRHRYGNYARLDENLWGYFAHWVTACQADGGEVWLVLSPYHPAIYPRLIAAPQNQLRTIEARVREFAAQHGLPCTGSYDPAVLGLASEDFFDGDHLLNAGLQRLLRPLAAPASAATTARTDSHAAL